MRSVPSVYKANPVNLGHDGQMCPLNINGPFEWTSDAFTIVASSGIFVHKVVWCRCNGATAQDKHLQLLRAHLFPSSITKPQTAFTFAVLDEFLIEALECKTSAYQKLHRLTNNPFPDTLPVSSDVLDCPIINIDH